MTTPEFSSGPAFRQLTRDEAEAVLTRNHLGRIAFTFHDRPDIEPVHYVYADGWIYGRTSHGTKLDVIAHNPWVAFETDEQEGTFDWRSVVVKGRVEIVPADPASPVKHVYWRAVELLRALTPEMFRGDDPVPFRHVIFRIHLDEVTGRDAHSVSEGGAPTATVRGGPGAPTPARET